ncbi:hypothetical protein [Methylobacterium sp. WL7]|uniref:hypothetical protein n=1 Tax=Methylobacterium sp. WL7 TaxID=2603900 RepID=UPI0011C74EC8|nr:hypothetical protein [Methylobacterium sp. WL7]TXN43867.1 hypothetical protein FV233_16820 [Methylobacterium sp. WL7]
MEGSQPSEDAKHRRYERMVGGVTLIATLAAAGFAGGAYVQAKRQADIAQAALIESDHPFLDLGIKRNADVPRGGKAYLSTTLTITNQGSRAAALRYAEFAIVDKGTVPEAMSVIAKPGLAALGLNCAGQAIGKVIPAGRGIRIECNSVVPKQNGIAQHLIGAMFYSGQLGTQWRRTVNLVEMTNGDWIDTRPFQELETKIDPALP